MARSPQGSGARRKPAGKQAAARQATGGLELPPSPRALGIDDLMGEFAGMATPAPVASIDLDDILGELGGPASEPASAVAAGPVADLDAMLDHLATLAPAPAEAAGKGEGAAAVEELDDILGELTPVPTTGPAVASDPFDDLLGEMTAAVEEQAAVDPDAAPTPGVARVAAIADSASERPRNDRAGATTRRRRVRLWLVGGAALLATHALAFWLGSVAHTAATPDGPAVAESASAEVEAPPVEGLVRYAGHDMDFRIDGRTMFEDEQFRGAVDELVGGPEASDALASLLPHARATEPVMRRGTKLNVRACNPEACGLENLTVEYDLTAGRVMICVTQGPGDPPVAVSTLYDEEGAREVPNCAGYPHPPAANPRRHAVAAAEPENPADITLSARDTERSSLSERIHDELARLRGERKRKSRTE